MEKLDGEYPGFKDRLIDENGDLRYFVNIYLNGEDVRFLDGLDTTTNSGDEVSIVPRRGRRLAATPAGRLHLSQTERAPCRRSSCYQPYRVYLCHQGVGYHMERGKRL